MCSASFLQKIFFFFLVLLSMTIYPRSIYERIKLNDHDAHARSHHNVSFDTHT